MTININNLNVEILLDEITRITGESRTEAIRKALEERRQRLVTQPESVTESAGLLKFLQEEVWPHIPPDQLGVRLGKADEEQILGYGEQGA